MHYNVTRPSPARTAAAVPARAPSPCRSSWLRICPAPLVVKDGDRFRLDYDRPKSIGRVPQFLWQRRHPAAWLLLHPHARARRIARVSARTPSSTPTTCSPCVKDAYEVPYGDRCMHEFVASARSCGAKRHISAMDIAKRLLDFGYPCADCVFPSGRSRSPDDRADGNGKQGNPRRLRRDADAILDEAPEKLHEAPHTLGISRPDEVKAAREPVLHWLGS